MFFVRISFLSLFWRNGSRTLVLFHWPTAAISSFAFSFFNFPIFFLVVFYFFPINILLFLSFFFFASTKLRFLQFFFTCLGRQLGNDGAKLNNMIQNKADILFFFCSWHKNLIEKNASLFLPMRHCWVIDLLFPPRSRLPVETGSRQSLFIVEGTGESFLLSFPSIEQKRWRHCILSTCCG